MRPQLGAEGRFADTPFEQVLIHCLDKRYTGRLYIEPPLGPAAELEILEGVVVRAIPSDNYARLGDVLVDANVITKAERKTALAQGTTIGRAIVQAGLIDETTLKRSLILQLLKREVRIFGFPPTTVYRVELGSPECFKELAGDQVRLDPLRVLWAGLSKYGHLSPRLKPTLERIGDSPFQIRQGANVARFGFADDARLVTDLLQEQILSLPELVAQNPAPDAVCRRIIYVLTITRYLDFSPVAEREEIEDPISTDSVSIGDSERPPSSDEPRATARVARIKLRRVAVRQGAAPDIPGAGEPRALTGGLLVDDSADEETIAQRRQHVLDRAARLKELSPWELLEISPEVIAGMAEGVISELLLRAYQGCTKRWHPEICPPALQDVAPQAEIVYRAITEAYMKLTDPEARELYIPDDDDF